MTTDIEQLLRDGMERSTRGLMVPAGLARKAARHLRRRQRRARVASAAGTAAALTAGAVVAGATGASSPATGPRVPTAAYVVSRFERAAAAASDGRYIQYARGRYSADAGSSPVVDGWVASAPTYPGYPWNTGSTVALSYAGLSRLYAAGPHGQPMFGERITSAHGKPVTTAVIYWNRTWWRMPGRNLAKTPARAGPRPRHVKFGMVTTDGMSPGIPSLRRMVKADLAHHVLRVAGHQRIDGVNTIRLVGIPGNILWVNATNYLPVRFRFTLSSGYGGRPSLVVQTDYRLLAPTPARLALLRLRVPHGFKRVTS